MRRALIVVGAAVATVLGMAISVALTRLESPKDQLLTLAFGDDGTVYAPGYSESAFRSIRLGMTTEQVKAILGAPLAEGKDENGAPVIWRYSASPRKGNYHYRGVRFDAKGNVVERIAEFYVD